MPNGFAFATSTVADGNMSERFDVPDVVRDNRARFLARIGVSDRRIAVMHVTHGDSIVLLHCGEIPQGTIEAEALMTDDSAVALFLLTADCLPVAYMDRIRGAFALAHLGWRPATKGLAGKVVREMYAQFGTEPHDLVVAIGPGISSESYALDAVEQSSDAWKPFVVPGSDGRIHVDLKGFVRTELMAHGVLASSIITHPSDTGADPAYFSHYRSRTMGEPEGRMASAMCRV